MIFTLGQSSESICTKRRTCYSPLLVLTMRPVTSAMYTLGECPDLTVLLLFNNVPPATTVAHRPQLSPLTLTTSPVNGPRHSCPPCRFLSQPPFSFLPRHLASEQDENICTFMKTLTWLGNKSACSHTCTRTRTFWHRKAEICLFSFFFYDGLCPRNLISVRYYPAEVFIPIKHSYLFFFFFLAALLSL